MFHAKSTFGALLFCAGIVGIAQSAMIKPNPIISRGAGVTVKVSAGDLTGINDNLFGPYDTKKWPVTDNSWIAVEVKAGTYSKVFITWNSPDTTWSDSIAVSGDSCRNSLKVPVDYNIETSANSTTGADGDWKTVDSVRGNSVGARGHLVDFTGAKWIRMNIVKGAGKIDEVEVFDATNGAEDTWFFLGTEITALMMKGKKASGYATDKSPPDSTFASMINLRNASFTPAVIRGGIQCGLKSGDIARDISKYLAVAGNVHFWAIELGTFDAWGGKADSAAAFRKNLQVIIDSCKAHQIQPVIARVIGTRATNDKQSKVKWQVHADFLAAVDDLAKTNKLVPGADLYAYTVTAVTMLGYLDLDAANGYLPNDYGNFEFQREWVKKMDTVVYKAPAVFASSSRPVVKSVPDFKVLSRSGNLVFSAALPGSATVFTTGGRVKETAVISSAGVYTRSIAPGYYMVRFKSVKGVEVVPVVSY